MLTHWSYRDVDTANISRTHLRPQIYLQAERRNVIHMVIMRLILGISKINIYCLT